MVATSNVYTTEDDIIQGCIKRDSRAQRALYDRFASKMLPVCMR